MRRKPGIVVISVLFAPLFVACSGDDSGEADPATVSLPDPVVLTSLQPSGGGSAVTSTVTAAGEDGVTETTGPAAATSDAPSLPRPPSYDVVSRIAGEAGDTVIVLLDPSSYTSLSDIDLENIVADVYDRFSPVFEAHIVDDPEAAARLAADGAAAVAASALSDHYLLRLEEGFRIVFLGPYEEFGTASLGS